MTSDHADQDRTHAQAAAAPAGRESEAGFSLIEVLASLVLTALLVSSLLPFVANVAARWMTGQRAVEDADLWMRASLRISADVARAVPIVVGNAKTPRVFWRGDESRIVFVRSPLSATDRAPLEVVAYSIEPAENGQSLVRRTTRYDPEAIDRDPTSFEVANAVISGPFRYTFTQVDHEGKRYGTWDKPKEMPARVELALEPSGRRPVLAAPITLTIPSMPPEEVFQVQHGDGQGNADQPPESGNQGGGG